MPTQADRSRGRNRIRRRLDGERFGRLVVVRFGGQHRTDGPNPRWIRLWSCDCDCGVTGVTIREDQLRRGKTKSCGCMKGVVNRAAADQRRGRKYWDERRAQQRAEERPLWEPWQELLRATMQERAVSHALLQKRWLGEPSPIAASMGVRARRRKPFEEIMSRTAPRVPEDDEVRFLAEHCLNLRGIEKDQFLKAARDAREAIKAHRAARRGIEPSSDPSRRAGVLISAF